MANVKFAVSAYTNLSKCNTSKYNTIKYNTSKYNTSNSHQRWKLLLSKT